jgi:hypothetical protein
MPFTSKRQLQTCFGKQLSQKNSKWDCKKWLAETERPECLPTLVGSPRKCISPRHGKTISQVYQGPRGGYYFYAGGIKVYVPRGTENKAMKQYGFAGSEKNRVRG